MNPPELLRTPVESPLLTAVTYSIDQTLQLEFRVAPCIAISPFPPRFSRV